MSAQKFEAFLALIYTDKKARLRFLNDPMTEAAKHGLSNGECEKLKSIDKTGLDFAARSFERKRTAKINHARKHFPI